MSGSEQRMKEILSTPQLACLATVTAQGKPWVRYVFCEASADLTVRFATYTDSRKVAQIAANPEVHLTCGGALKTEDGAYLQIEGRARFTTDQAEREGFWKDSLGRYFTGVDDARYGVVVIKPHRIELWVPGTPQPAVWAK